MKRSPAHKSDQFAELVCSNSLRSDNPESAIGLLHAELRALGSLMLRSADTHRVPAGDALAVEREKFSGAMTQAVREHPLVEVVHGEVEQLPEGPGGDGHRARSPRTRSPRSWSGTWAQKLYFYDSIAPILSGDSIDMDIAFRQSRYGKGDGDDYLNLPMTKEEYYRFIAEVKAGQKLTPHAFEEPKYFEGCLPIEVMAERGDETLAFGPMKPVGLMDPRTGQSAVRGGAAAHGGPGGHLVEHGGLPDAAQLGRAEAHLHHLHPRPGRTRSSCGWGRSTATRSSTRRGCWTRTCRSRPSGGCSSPGRSPGWRATWSPRRVAYLVALAV